MNDEKHSNMIETMILAAGVGLLAVGVISLFFGCNVHNGETLHAAACFGVSTIAFGLVFCLIYRK